MKGIIHKIILPLSVLGAILLVGLTFYSPGLPPVTFCRDEPNNASFLWESDIPVWVNQLKSWQTVIPYEYHHFDFCTTEKVESPPKNLGQIILGDRKKFSAFNLKFLKNETWAVACIKNYTGGNEYDEGRLKSLRHGLELAYQHHWIVDNMPVTLCYQVQENYEYCALEFPMGCYMKDEGNCYGVQYAYPKRYYLFNHVDFVITYHSTSEQNWGQGTKENCGRITSIQVKPRSIAHTFVNDKVSGSDRGQYLEIPSEPLPQGKRITIAYTYSISFVMNDSIKWSSRWDYILKSMPEPHIQWYSILNSLAIALFFSAILARILSRTTNKVLAQDNQIESQKSVLKKPRWRLVEGDIFRPPGNGMMLSVFLGSGVQIFFMSLTTLGFARLGLFLPKNRESLLPRLLPCAIVSFVCFGFVAGYVSIRLYKSFGGKKWILNVLLTSMLSPGIIFSLFVIMNSVYQSTESSAAVPSITVINIMILWFGVSVPLTCVGAHLGLMEMDIEYPVYPNKIPREIPVQKLHTQVIPAAVIGGITPFGCVFIQLFFIMNSLWYTQVYNMFGSLFLVFLLLLITCSECTIIICYFHLCGEDYRWWWRSFFTSGFSAFYLLAYCIHFFYVKIDIEDAASTVLYFGYTAIMVFAFFLLTGSIGFFACFWFVRKIYGIPTVDDSEEFRKMETATEPEKTQ
ncbi:hypothetical protein QAD02_016836 [Eretmocerus hayati]|uniref:Uncharacterized protein n=1 Tax=Eretmocerus hayati TaxID=131215 RepID=A0ACC2PEQ2_9HYME|nr:hypothetical protein QAD02_016836 [Eretmocerus hayati]